MKRLLRRLWQVARHARFRFDVFISYARGGGGAYARELRDALRKRGFTCFLDEAEIQAGDELKKTLVKSLQGSATMVVVGTPKAAASPYVRLEIEEFARTGRRITPIRFGESVMAAPWAEIRGDTLVWIDETAEAESPSPPVVEKIDQSFEYAKRNTVRRLQALAAIGLVVAVALAVIATVMARRNAARSALDAVQEQGRYELLRGNPAQALVSLATVYGRRPGDPVVRYLVAAAARGITTEIATGARLKDVVWSADGRRLLTVPREGDAARLWTSAGLPVATLRRPGETRITAACFTHDGLIVTAGAHGFGIWTAEGGWIRDLPTTGQAVDLLEAAGRNRLLAAGNRAVLIDLTSGTSQPLPGARVFLSGNHEVIGTRDGQDRIRVFRSSDGALIRAFDERYKGPAALSPDGTVIALHTGTGGVIRLLDVATGAVVAVIPTSGFGEIAFHPGGARLAVGSASEVELWAFDEAQRTWGTAPRRRFSVVRKADETFVSDAFPLRFRFSPDGQRIALTTWWSDFEVRTLDVETGERLDTLGPVPQIDVMRFSADGRRLAAATEDGAVWLWDAARDGRIRTPFRGDDGALAAFTSDGRQVLWASHGLATRAATTGAAQPVTVAYPNSAEQALAASISDDGRRAVVTENGNGSFLIDFAERRAVSAGDKGLAAISHDGEWLAFADDRQVVVRPRGGGGSPQTIATATQAVTEFSPHSRFLLVREPNDRVVVQDLRRRQTVLKSQGCHAAFSSDERRLALLDCKPREKAGAIRLESLDGSEKPLIFGAGERFQQAIDFAHAVVFSPDGRWLATGATEGPLRIWSTADGRLLQTLSERNRTLDASFSASGAELVATDGATARLWDTQRGVLLAAFTQPYEQLHAVRFVGDGEAVIAFACDNGLLPWEHVAVPVWTTERETRRPEEIAGLAKLVAANSGHVRRGLNPADIRAP